ncbi:MAG: rod shape-determining protein MreD [Sphingomonas sp.]
MIAPVRGPFDEPRSAGWRRALPALSIMAGSAITVWPIIATFPYLPPFGLMMLLAWRLVRPDTLAIWAPLPLGLFDDLLSGQPLGSAILLWSICFFVIDLVDQRLVFRDFWQDWLIASGALAFGLIAGRLVAVPFGAHVDTVLWVQIMVSMMLFPLAARLCLWFDRKRVSE